MKKIIILFILLFFSCKSHYDVLSTIDTREIGTQVYVENTTMIYTQHVLGQYCETHCIPNDIGLWNHMSFVGDDKTVYEYYIYVNKDTVYTIQPVDNISGMCIIVQKYLETIE